MSEAPESQPNPDEDPPEPRSMSHDLGELFVAGNLFAVALVVPVFAVGDLFDLEVPPGALAFGLPIVTIIATGLLLRRLHRRGLGALERWMGNTRPQLAWMILVLAICLLNVSREAFEEWRRPGELEGKYREAWDEVRAAITTGAALEPSFEWALRNGYRIRHSYTGDRGTRMLIFERPEDRSLPRHERPSLHFMGREAGIRAWVDN